MSKKLVANGNDDNDDDADDDESHGTYEEQSSLFAHPYAGTCYSRCITVHECLWKGDVEEGDTREPAEHITHGPEAMEEFRRSRGQNNEVGGKTTTTTLANAHEVQAERIHNAHRTSYHSLSSSSDIKSGSPLGESLRGSTG
ncbi:hypothetical protein AYO21_11513 [Fonsecaea monophora]|uniref:Uncharacterized protein n=1 Tax=Fonsecaea monophora TaxID=254056 RepID=A0A177EQQ7_9EURO|nr:hypothetical protein AYO21_11513 [Fonsecaea monophora]OAG34333.1 hypothetical protein AYO21_11513 [Fonsecaea monophora]